MTSAAERPSGTAGPSHDNKGQTRVSVSEYIGVIEEFLALSSFKLPPYQHDEEDFNQEVIKGCMSVQDPQKRSSLAGVGASAAKWLYPSHDRKAQLMIATFTALMFSVDDLGGRFPEDLRSYRKNLMLRQPQDNQQVADFLDLTFQMDDWLDAFAVDMIFKGQLEFLSANLVENEHGHQLLPLQSTPRFLREYFRLKSGISEPYAFFIWPSDIMVQAGKHSCAPLAVMPDLMTWINDTNDIMSFYKESVIGDEQSNVISLHAKATGQTPLEAVKSSAKLALDAFGRMNEFAKVQEPEVRRKLEEFVQGCIAFHYENPRYFLKELGIKLPNPDRTEPSAEL